MVNRSINLGGYLIRDEGTRIVIEHEDTGTLWSFALDPGTDPDRVLRAADALLQQDLDDHTLDSAAHHTRYTDAEAQAAIDATYADAIHGDAAHSVDYVSQTELTDHEALPGVHHTRYTDAEAQAALSTTVAGLADDPHGNEAHTDNFVVPTDLDPYATDLDLQGHADATTGVHGVGTSTVASQDDISTHSGDAAAHHARYTDQEAVDAVSLNLSDEFVSTGGDLMSGPLEVDSTIAQLQLISGTDRLGIRGGADGITLGKMMDGAFTDESRLRWTRGVSSWQLYRNNDQFYHEGNLNPAEIGHGNEAHSTDFLSSLSVRGGGVSADVTDLVFDMNLSLINEGGGTVTVSKDPYTDHPAITEPPAPSDGLRVFTDSADNSLKVKDTLGGVTNVGSGSGSGTFDHTLTQTLDANSQDIVGADMVEQTLSIHSHDIDQSYTIPAGSGTVVSDELSGTGEISGEGSVTILDDGVFDSTVRQFSNATSAELETNEYGVDTNREGTGTTSLLYKDNAGDVHYWDADGTLNQ